jgi:hypothetical protein
LYVFVTQISSLVYPISLVANTEYITSEGDFHWWCDFLRDVDMAQNRDQLFGPKAVHVSYSHPSIKHPRNGSNVEIPIKKTMVRLQ